jgi:hypothetical protein
MPLLGARDGEARSRRLGDTDGILSTHDRPHLPAIGQILPSDRQILPAIPRKPGAVERPNRAKPLSSGGNVIDREQGAALLESKQHAVQR